MEDLIKQAFLHVEVIGPHVQEGHYDLIGPDGEIILPVVWDKTIQPGWQVSMRMWPENKHPLPGPPHGQHMTPEQRMHFMMQQHRHRQAQAAAAQGGHGGGHHGGHGPRVQAMRPQPGFTGVPVGGQPPPPPPGGRFFPPPGGEGGRPGIPGMVSIVEGGRPKKDKGKRAKKTLGFFSGTKPSKKGSSSKKFVYTEPVWET